MKHRRQNKPIFDMKIFRLAAAFLCATLLLTLCRPTTALADTGPKPSVRILFENMGDELCYGTLLSKNSSTGPASVWDGNEHHAEHNENENYSWAAFDYETWKAFVEYEDSDGYYFLQKGWVVSETKKIEWTYYPPSSFKILLYYPETGTFVVSDIYERYAFDTYYTVDMAGVNIGSVEYNEELSTDERKMDSVEYNKELSTDERIEAYRSYNYLVEIFSMAARIIITILLEMAVALLFGFREKKQEQLLIAVNTATQVLLNVLLNIINYNSGQRAFVVNYVLFELLVFVIEAVVYSRWMKKLSGHPKKTWFYVVYSLIANGVSFWAGLLVAELIPGIF